MRRLKGMLEEQIKAEGYKDADGNPILLNSLVRKEPDWAANIIRWYKEKLDKVAAEADREGDPEERLRDIAAIVDTKVVVIDD